MNSKNTRSPRYEITSVESDSGTAYFVYTDVSNWIILRSGDDLTLIDGGYPGQADAVVESIRMTGGRPEAVVGALLTHAHVDHIGGLAKVAARYGFPVYADELEVGHARREYLQQAAPADIAPLAIHGRGLRWLSKIIPLGALSKAGVAAAHAFPSTSNPPALDLPGAPVPVPAYGHTNGHSGFLVTDGEALISGDALISGHMTSALTGPQCLSKHFQHDVNANRAAVQSFTGLDAQILMPGHGPLLRTSVAQAAREALGR
ncbi:MBL fold metallo-hydrolase [Gordonia sp. CPCC 205333]|uniref:MBL fold metallo-hydrolase n=1 Tax=Gordonia sp. CPCC 205333 TaxID=3140790 RepID=UPI003AF3E261